MKSQYLCLILLFLSPLMLQAAASQENQTNYPHLVRLVLSERIWSNDNQSVVTIPIVQYPINIFVGNTTSTVKTDDIGELPVFLGRLDKLSWMVYFNNERLTGSINADDFYLRTHPITNETMLYYSEAINFHAYTKNIWNPINPLTYDTNNLFHMFILITSTFGISFTIMSSVFIIKNKMWQKE